MRIFISGAKGALGREVIGVLECEGIEFLAIDIDQLDITDFLKTRKTLLDYRPHAILHFAAVSDVDKCEEEPETALRVNAMSTLGLGILANKIDAKILYTSTNFIFDGNDERSYAEEDQPNPINTYGRTKMLGEEYVRNACARHFIVRTSWLFGGYSKNFISRFLNSKEKPSSIDAVCDRHASFTFTRNLAEALLLIIKSEHYGVFHIVNKGVGSFFDFLLKAKEVMKFKTEVRSIRAAELNLPASRPKYSPLASQNYERLFARQMPKWEDALAEFAAKPITQS